MKKTILIIGAFLLLASLLIAQAPAQQRRHVSNDACQQLHPGFRDRPGIAEPMMNCMEELKLTDKQMEKLEVLHSNFEKNRNTLQAEMDNIRIDIETAMKTENFARAKELTKQLNDKKSQLDQARIDFQANRIKEMTKEQKEILKKNMPNMMGKRGFHRGFGMQGNRGNMGERQYLHRGGEDCDDCSDCGDKKDDAPRKHLNPDYKNKNEMKK